MFALDFSMATSNARLRNSSAIGVIVDDDGKTRTTSLAATGSAMEADLVAEPRSATLLLESTRAVSHRRSLDRTGNGHGVQSGTSSEQGVNRRATR